jgi:hypothetical protein
MWIDEERDQAEELSMRAAKLEDLGLTSGAHIFREVVKLCDRKIALMKEIDERRDFIQNIRTAAQASVLGDTKKRA